MSNLHVDKKKEIYYKFFREGDFLRDMSPLSGGGGSTPCTQKKTSVKEHD